MATVIGYDPGFGNTKVCITSSVEDSYKTSMVQSAIAKPNVIGKATVGFKTAAPFMRVKVDGQEFCVGENAWLWGKPLSNMDYFALASPEKKALFYAALSGLLPPGDVEIDLLVIGLPVPLLKDAKQAEAVIRALKVYKGNQSFQTNNITYNLNIKKFKYVAQPVGTYSGWLLNDQNSVEIGKENCEVAVLDLGMNTLDLYVLKGDSVRPGFIGGDKVGVRRLLNRISKDGFGLEELDSDLRNGRLKVPPSVLESWLAEIMGIIEPTWPSLSRFAAVIPTGGGSALLNSHLQEALTDKGAFVYWPEDPILANAIGLWKWGKNVLNS